MLTRTLPPQSVLLFSIYYPEDRVFGSTTRLARILRWFDDHGVRIHIVKLTRKLANSHLPLVRSPFRSRLSMAGCRVEGETTAPWDDMTRERSFLAQRWWLRARHARRPVRARIDELIARTGADVVWVNHSYLAPLANLLPTDNRVLRIVDTHDVMHLRDETFRSADWRPENGVSREQERRLLTEYDVVLAIQDQERRILDEMLPGQKVITLAHAMEVDPQPCHTADICFVGSQYKVNERNLLAFVESSWPAIRRQCPTTRLLVAGGVCKCGAVARAAAKDERIVLRGLVAATREMYAGPAVVICPVGIGSGLKIKLVEALAHGKAVVATPIAAQGLEHVAGAVFAQVERPGDFVGPVVRIIRDAAYRQRFEAAAIDFVRRECNQQRVYYELREVLDNWWGAGSATRRAA
jgi:succinoglycan biosynthesis protein ExoO